MAFTIEEKNAIYYIAVLLTDKHVSEWLNNPGVTRSYESAFNEEFPVYLDYAAKAYKQAKKLLK